MFFKENNKQNKDTIIFYVADWCSHCQKIKPFINECKKSKLLNITVKNAEEMNNEEKKQINGFPTAIRNSDNNIAVGEVQIKNLVKQTLNKSNIEHFNTKKDIIFYLDTPLNVVDDPALNLINYININSNGYNLIVKYKNDIRYTDTDFSGNIINSYPTAVELNNGKRTHYGYNEVFSLLERVLSIQIFKDTINYYEAEWCKENCQPVKELIEKLKNERQIKIKINIIDFKDISGNDTELIQHFPAIKRLRDDMLGFGVIDINAIINNTLFPPTPTPPTPQQIEGFTTENDSKDTIQFYIAEWCGHSQRLMPYIEEYKNRQNVVNVEIIYEKDIPGELNITGYPTAIRKSDNKRASGGPPILNLMKETEAAANTNNIQEANPENNSGNNSDNNKILVFLAEWCPHCQNFKPQLTEIMKTNKNIKLIDSNDITPELQKYIQGFPSALKESDKTVAVGAPEILKMINSNTENKPDDKPDDKPDVKPENNSDNNKIIVFLAEWCQHCQNFKPELTKIMKTNNNIKLVDSNDITPELQKYIHGFPSALKESDKTVASGASEILKMINSNTENKSTYTFVYSNNCKYCQMIMPKWLEFKLHATDNKLNVNLLEYESKDFNNLPDNYKSQIVGFPTLFVNNDKKYEGYDDMINCLNNLL
jgi:thiol-disulfide isomerase/thioredoxin